MAEPILHHHDPSPFAEKIRLVFGLKRLAWQSVRLSMVMPRPALMPLSGGYRKVPVLQIGADVYCDTRLIVAELERRYPAPTIFPGASSGLSLALAAWSDRSFFEPGAGLALGLNRASIPLEVIEDRKGFFNFMDFARLEADIPHLFTQFRSNLDLLEQMLSDGRSWVLGVGPSFADIDAYFPVWMARGNLGAAEGLLAQFPKLLAFEARMRAIGHGTRREIDAAEALSIARASSPASAGKVTEDEIGVRHGARVTVTPDDYGRIPVQGELVTLTLREVAVRRVTPETGEVVVHFPRSGYRVAPAS